MNTTEIIKALEKAEFVKGWNKKVIKYDNEFTRKYNCDLDDYFDILDEKTPFRFLQVPRKNGKGFHSKPYICMM